MSNDNQNRTKGSIDVRKIENEHENNPALEMILFILFPLLVLAHRSSVRLSTRAYVWRLKEWTRKILLLHLLSIPTAVFSIYLAYSTFSVSHLYLLLVWIGIFYFSSLPTALLIISSQLTQISVEISQASFPLKYLSATLHAILMNGFDRSRRRFEFIGMKLPIYSESSRAVIGLDAHPMDYRPRKLRKDIPDRYRMDSAVENGFVVFDQDKNSPKSQLVIGITGSGKTRLLSRMALAALAEDWRVIIVDFKGGQEEREEYSSLGDYLPSKFIRVVNFPGMPIDLFRGSKRDIADRLISCLPASTGGDSDFYRDRAVRAISAVVERTSAPAPQDIASLFGRIRNGEAYADDEADREFFKQKERGVPIGHILADSIASRFEPLRRTGEWATSNGFSWGDPWELAVFSLDATREIEVRLGDLILMDFDMWLRSDARRTQPKPILLIVDEAGVLEKLPTGSINLLNIVSRGRNNREGVVIASQTIASLGVNYVGLNEQISSKWIGRSNNPEELINMIGTKEVIEVAYEFNNGEWSAPKSARQQRAYIIDPDAIRQLPTFFWNYSEGSKNRFVYAPPLRKLI